jgi:hypothetical protein
MKRRKKKQTEYAFITIEVDDYSVRCEAGINYHLHGSLYPFDHEDEPIYSFETVLHISGACTEPEDHAGHRCDITLYGMPDEQRNTPSIKDLHERDEHGSPKYRKRRGQDYPVYAPAPPIVYSHPTLPPILRQSCHPFSLKAATDSHESCHPLMGR